MNIKDYSDLAHALRLVGQEFDAEKRVRDWDTIFDCGICAAVHRYAKSGDTDLILTVDAYEGVDCLLAEIQEGWTINDGRILAEYSYEREGWADRATMCLLMAEWVESELA